MAVCTSIFVGLLLLCVKFGWRTEAAGDQGGQSEGQIESECRDRYLWVHVASTGAPPQFEAVDHQGVYTISGQTAVSCGYTISKFKMDGYTTFKASYYSCYTSNQNDEVFTFNLNVILMDADGRWWRQPLSKACVPTLAQAQREVICEEDYMEVGVNRDIPCEGYHGGSKDLQEGVLSLAQKTATSVWQLMFLLADDDLVIMTASEAQGLGYSLKVSSKRLVFRSPYKQPHSQLLLVHGVSVELIKVVLFFRRKLVVVMSDVSLACTVNSGSFDGHQLLWDLPQVMPPMVWTGVGFGSQSIRLGVEGRLLDWDMTAARGWTVTQQGPLVQVGIPFGSEGGYRQSMVVNGVYRETYVIFLYYEHIFSMLYDDGGKVETRQRLVRVLDTPLNCRHPFILDQTVDAERVFNVYLGNIPFDVTLTELKLNNRRLPVAMTPEYGISRDVHNNGSQAYVLQVPFDSRVVDRMHLDQGHVRYSMNLNYTLTLLPQRLLYYHHAFVFAQLDNAFAPEPMAECTPAGITFSLWKSPNIEFLWEIGVGADPLTAELADLRGYRLHNGTNSITLDVPLFSIGYTYENINLQDFHGTFQLIVRDAKTLAVQSSISKSCVFQTQDLIVCSSDGIVTVVTTPTVTLPRVHPEYTTLLDRSCRPTQTDPSRALFAFSVNSCGTRMMVGEYYVVYENEILYERQLLADGAALISRESKFKLTVRCFYPLSTISRLTADRVFPSDTPGLGFILGTKGLTMPPKCPVANSPFSEKSNPPATGGAPPSNSFPDPWAGQQGLQPRSSSPPGRGDVSESADNSLAFSFYPESPVNPSEAHVDATDQSAVQQLWGSLDTEPQYNSNLELAHGTATFNQGSLNPQNLQNLSQSINSPSSEKQNVLNNPNHNQQTMSESALYFKEHLKANVATKDNQPTTPVTTTTPPVSTTSAVSSQNTMGNHLV